MLARILATLSAIILAVFAFGRAPESNHSTWYSILIWGGVIASVATITVALLYVRRKTRFLLAIAGAIGAVSLISFRVLPLGSINIAGYAGALLAMVLFAIAAFLPERFLH